MPVHNANRQIETPEDLSCFTPSPVASSPNAPSPVLPRFQTPDLLLNMDYIVPQHNESVTLDFRSRDSEAVDDIIEAVRCLVKTIFDCDLSSYRIIGQRLTLSRITRSALFSLVVFQKVFHIGSGFDCFIQVVPASTNPERKKFLISLRISDVTPVATYVVVQMDLKSLLRHLGVKYSSILRV